jgi:Tfp pilus assembly protein PilO
MRINRSQVRLALVIVGLSLAFIFALWLPQQGRERRLQARIEAAQQQRVAERDHAADLANLSRTVAQLRTTVAQAPRSVPPQGEMAALLRQLTAEAGQDRLGQQEVGTQQVIVGTDFCLMPLNLSMKGSFPAVFAYLDRIESLPRIMQINRLDVSGNAAKPADPVAVRIELSAFFLPAEEAAQ